MTTVSQTTPAEDAWIEAQLQRARELVAEHSGSEELTLESLEETWSTWIHLGEADTRKVNEVINAVGIALGQALAETTELKWAIARDDDGRTDLALYALPDRGDVLVYPANLVAKRWEKRQVGFIRSLYTAIAEQVAQLAAGGPATSKKAWWKFW